jgi:hypothetical protein
MIDCYIYYFLKSWISNNLWSNYSHSNGSRNFSRVIHAQVRKMCCSKNKSHTTTLGREYTFHISDKANTKFQ